MKTQLKVVAVLLFLVGAGLIGYALWWVYRPLCPAFAGAALLYLSKAATREANGC